MDSDAPGSNAPSTPPPGDRRSRSDRREGGDRRKRHVPVDEERRTGADRRGTGDRRRGMNQYDLSEDELELIRAVARHKERTGRPFPTWSEVLEIVRSLGYEKR